jgi:DHA3 family macrolide efflux protein-like MFS transporter
MTATLALLRQRNFLLLWLAQLLAGVGDVFYQVGIMVTVFERTGSALQTATVMVATTLPPFLLGPVAGTAVDRVPRRSMLLAMQAMRALLVGSLLLQVSQAQFDLWLVYLTVAGLAIARAFYNPARQAIIPSLVQREDLVGANTLIITSQQLTQALGFMLGAILISQLGLELMIWIDLAAFLAAGLLLIPLRVRARPSDQLQTRVKQSVWRDFRDGWRYFRQHPVARPLVIMEWLEHVPHGVWTAALTLVFIIEGLGATTVEWGFQDGAFYGGQVIGAVIATRLVRPLNNRPGWFIIFNAFLLSFATMIYALSPNVWFTIIVSFFFGPPFALRDVAQNALLQATVEEEILGRVYALREMGWNILFMLGGLGFAALADFLPIRVIYLIAAGLYFLVSLYAASSKGLRESKIGESMPGRENPVSQ